MVLILSIDGDSSTDYVISWLQYFQHPFFRLNAYDLVEKEIVLDPLNNQLWIGNKLWDFNKIGAVWYRKSRFYRESQHFSTIGKHIGWESAHNIATEFSSIYNTLLNCLCDKKWLTHPNSANLNKLSVLKLAASFGLNIPSSFIVSTRKQLTSLAEKGNIISKSVYNPRPLEYKRGGYTMFTARLDKKEIETLPERFFPSLIQNEIRKKYEVRSFYLMGKFYSMAIFSQEKATTEVDFRKYDWANPTRNVPYKLPEREEKKLSKLLKALNLNCASLDLIKGVDDQYYFLEINPNGQFGMVDFNCNYGLHKKVAQTLIDMDQQVNKEELELWKDLKMN